MLLYSFSRQEQDVGLCFSVEVLLHSSYDLESSVTGNRSEIKAWHHSKGAKLLIPRRITPGLSGDGDLLISFTSGWRNAEPSLIFSDPQTADVTRRQGSAGFLDVRPKLCVALRGPLDSPNFRCFCCFAGFALDAIFAHYWRSYWTAKCRRNSTQSNTIPYHTY